MLSKRRFRSYWKDVLSLPVEFIREELKENLPNEIQIQKTFYLVGRISGAMVLCLGFADFLLVSPNLLKIELCPVRSFLEITGYE